jgi:LemA protein
LYKIPYGSNQNENIGIGATGTMKYKLAVGCGLLVGLIALVGIMAVIFGIAAHNKMVRLEEGVKEKWSRVEDIYRQRLDLISNLVETVKGYADDEKETFQAAAEARTKASATLGGPGRALTDPRQFRQLQQARDALSGTLQRLMQAVERRPELKTNQNVLALQNQLKGIEKRFNKEKQGFNEAVGKYNMYIKQFPHTVIANMSGFKQKPVWGPGKAQTGQQNRNIN